MITLLLLLLLTSCVKTEVIHEVLQQQDTVMMKKPHKPLHPPKDTTDQDGRVPITFNPSVEDWEEQDINI